MAGSRIGVVILAGFLVTVGMPGRANDATRNPAPGGEVAPPGTGASAAELAGDELEAATAELLAIRRIYVEKLTGGETAAQIRDMLIAAIQAKRVFLLTEDPERADAVLRGSAEDLVYTEQFAAGEGVNARAALGVPTNDTGRVGSRLSLLTGIGENESIRKSERRHEAMASVRLVSKAGDVIWSTTEESLGAKFRSSSADVAEKVAKRLADAVHQARRGRAMPAPGPAEEGNSGKQGQAAATAPSAKP